MRNTWNSGDWIVLNLGDNVYSIARMSDTRHYLHYYLHFTENDDVPADDLQNLKPEFCCGQLGVVKTLGIRRIKSAGDDAGLAIPPLWIRPNPGGPGRAFKGGNLTRCDPARGPFPDDPIVKADLAADHDLDEIRRHELTNMMDHQTIQDRLLACRKYKMNVDPLKLKIFDLSLKELYDLD